MPYANLVNILWNKKSSSTHTVIAVTEIAPRDDDAAAAPSTVTAPKPNIHLAICNEIRQLYIDTDGVFEILKWLLDFAHRSGGTISTIAAVVDLMKLRQPDESVMRKAFEYLYNNREYLFFANETLWMILESCHCANYANVLKPVGHLFVLLVSLRIFRHQLNDCRD